MKVSKTLQTLLVVTTLLFLPLNLMASCDDTYSACVQKCDETENVSENCYSSCDDTYAKCLDKEQNGDLYTEPEQVEEKLQEQQVQ